MKNRLKLVINVTRDKRVHSRLEGVIVGDRTVAGAFHRRYIMSRDELLEQIRDADVLFSFAVPEQAIHNAARLRWIHLASAGVEKSLSPALLTSDIEVTCSRGLHADTIAEYVMMQILAYSKNLRQAYAYQEKRQWRFEELLPGKFDIKGKTIAIIGLGFIGRRVARLANAFDMRVIGTVNHVRKIRYVDRVYSPSQLNRCLRDADFIVLAVPHTKDTFHLIGPRQISSMKKDACLINIGRGKLIDETELIKALRAGRLGGATLDVFEEEPLPANSPLWRMKNVVVTPHYAGMAENLWRSVGELFVKNAARYLHKQKLLGIVSKSRGY